MPSNKVDRCSARYVKSASWSSLCDFRVDGNQNYTVSDENIAI